MKYRKEKSPHFKKVGIEGWVLLSKKESPKAGVVIIETKRGHETIIKSTKNAWLYFILEGKGYFMINEKKIKCEKGDLIVIPQNTPFYYRGKLKMLLITVPAWAERYEVTIGKVPKTR